MITKLFTGSTFNQKGTIMPAFPQDEQPTSIEKLDLPPIYSTLPVSPQDH